jgi:hypothetical protein
MGAEQQGLSPRQGPPDGQQISSGQELPAGQQAPAARQGPAAQQPTAAQQISGKREAAAFYHDPPLWVGRNPVDQTGQVAPDFDAFRQAVFRQKLDSGVEVKVTVEGLFAFGFEGWRLGIFPSAEIDRPPDLDATAEVILVGRRS